MEELLNGSLLFSRSETQYRNKYANETTGDR